MAARRGPRAARGPIVTLTGPAREALVPILKESFTGYYRWHAKRQLREVPVVRALRRDGAWWGAAELDRLAPGVGYVYYLFVGRAHRRAGVGAALLDDALDRFRADGASLVYAVAEATNRGSLALFRSRGFRTVRANERSWQEGGLSPRGLRSRMWIVGGEVVLGRRLAAPRRPRAARPGTAASRPTPPPPRRRGRSTPACR